MTTVSTFIRQWREWDLDQRWQTEWIWAKWPHWSAWHDDDKPPATPPPQPLSTQQEVSLELCGFRIVATSGGCSVAVRRHLLEAAETCWAHADDKFAAVIVRLHFYEEVLGGKDLVVGSLHVNNKAAKKSEVSRQLMETFFSRCAEFGVDLVGFDANQVAGRLPSMSPPGSVVLRPPIEVDCVGMVAPQWSRLLAEDVRLHGAKFFNAAQSDLGLRETDADSHYLVTGVWRLTGVPRVRNPATKKAARKRQQEAQRDRAKAAASSSSAAP